MGLTAKAKANPTPCASHSATQSRHVRLAAGLESRNSTISRNCSQPATAIGWYPVEKPVHT